MINWLKKIFVPASPATTAPLFENAQPQDELTLVAKRVHQRHSSAHLVHLQLFYGQGRQAKILNISYGGVLLRASREELAPFLQEPDQCFEAELAIHHVRHRCRLLYIHQSEGGVGCSFVHADTSMLAFLREYLEHLRIGASLTFDRHRVKAPGEDGAVFYHGYEDTRLALAKDDHDKPLLCKLNLMLGDSPAELVWRRDSGLQLHPPHKGRELLQKAIFILEGFLGGGREPLISEVLESFLSYRDGTHSKDGK